MKLRALDGELNCVMDFTSTIVSYRWLPEGITPFNIAFSCYVPPLAVDVFEKGQ